MQEHVWIVQIYLLGHWRVKTWAYTRDAARSIARQTQCQSRIRKFVAA